MEELENRIPKVNLNVPHDFLQTAVDFFPGGLRKLADAAGAYVKLKSIRPNCHLKRYM